MKLTILGCNGAIPAHGRYPTSQILDTGNELIMIDCGEGAQMQMQKYGIKSSRIKYVCISHMHGDHYYGLIGWLTSQGLLGRTAPVHIYAPSNLKHIIAAQIDYALPFDIRFTDLENDTMKLVDTEQLEIFAFTVDHSITTYGFRITKKFKPRIVDAAAATAHNIPQYFLGKLAEGFDYAPEHGTFVANDLVTKPGKPKIVYSYSADTAYCEGIIEHIQGSTLLYHEATYTDEYLNDATERKHSTARQAATIAQKANVQKLVIGHYSSKFKVVDDLYTQALEVFTNTDFALEGKEFVIEHLEAQL